mgnify:FL=1
MQTPRIDLPSKAMSMTEEEILTLDDDATDTPMEEVQVAGMGPLTEQARGALRRLGLLPAPEDTGIGSSLTTELGRARLKARELEKREAELSETIAGQTEVRGVRGIGGGQAEITDESLVPLPRYKVSETETGFIVLDEADGTVLDIFETQAEAAAFVTNRATLSRSGPPEPTITPNADDAVPPEQLDPDAGMDQENLFERTQAEGKYDQHTEIDLGDDQLNTLLENRLNNPKLQAGVLGGIRMVGEAGDDKVPDEGNIRNLIGEMAAQIQGQLPKQLTEPLRNEQLRDMADLVGMDSAQLAKRMRNGFQIDPKNPGALAAHVVAAKDLLVSEVKKLDQLADAAGPGATLMAKLEWKQQANLVANLQAMYKGAQTDIARALAALRIPNRDDAALLERDFARLVEDIGGEKTLDEQIESYKAIGADELHKKLKYARGASFINRAFSAAHEMWINSILSGYWTHVKNIAGGLSAILADDMVLAYSAVRQSLDVGAQRQITGQQADVTFGDVKARLYGQLMAFQEAFSESATRFVTREEIYGTSKIENLGTIQNPSFAGRTISEQGDAFSGSGLGLSGGLATLADVLGTVATGGRWSTRALVAEDTFMKVLAYRGSLYEQAYREARTRGKEGDDLSTFVANFIHNPPEKAIEEAKDLARYVTLQTDMDGQLADLQKFMRKTPLMRWIVPFYKTPTNALLWIVDHSPAAPLTKRYQDDMLAGGARAAQARSRVQLGMVAFGGAYMAMANGKCVGGISADKDVRATYQNQGIMPYSCKIGDYWIPINTFEPVSSILMLVADVYETVNHPSMKSKDIDEVISGAIGAIGYSFTQKSFMAGLQKFTKAIGDPAKYGQRLLEGYGRSMIPQSGALNEIRRLNDDIKRFRYDYLDGLMDRLPGLSTQLPAERDYWGRKTTLHRAYSPHKPNRIDIEFGRLGYGPEPHPNGYGFEFNPDERDFFKQRAGQLSKQFMEEFMDGKRSAGKVEDFRRHQAMSMRSSGEFKQKIDKELRQAFAELAHDAQEEAHEDVKDRFPGYIKAMEDQEEFEMKQTEIYMKRLGID